MQIIARILSFLFIMVIPIAAMETPEKVTSSWNMTYNWEIKPIGEWTPFVTLDTNQNDSKNNCQTVILLVCPYNSTFQKVFSKEKPKKMSVLANDKIALGIKASTEEAAAKIQSILDKIDSSEKREKIWKQEAAIIEAYYWYKRLWRDQERQKVQEEIQKTPEKTISSSYNWYSGCIDGDYWRDNCVKIQKEENPLKFTLILENYKSHLYIDYVFQQLKSEFPTEFKNELEEMYTTIREGIPLGDEGPYREIIKNPSIPYGVYAYFIQHSNTYKNVEF